MKAVPTVSKFFQKSIMKYFKFNNKKQYKNRHKTRLEKLICGVELLKQ